MIDIPHIVRTTEQLTAVIPLKIPRAQIQQVMGPGIQELMSTLAKQGITPAGPWFTHHFRMDPATFDFEIGVPVPQPVKPEGRVKGGSLPAVTAARTIYHGPYERLAQAWGELEQWIADQGRKSAAWLWETYLTDPSKNPDPATWRTELTRPLVG